MGIVSVAALAIVGIFSSLMLSTSKSSDQAGAELLANSLLEKATREGPPDWGVGPGNKSRRLETGDRSQATNFFYQVDTERIDDHDLGELFKVVVTVNWSDQEGEQSSRQGQGNLWLKRSRLLYLEKN